MHAIEGGEDGMNFMIASLIKVKRNCNRSRKRSPRIFTKASQRVIAELVGILSLRMLIQ